MEQMNRDGTTLKCAVCQAVTNKTCGYCKSAFYCSRDCQATDWIYHAKFCALLGAAQKRQREPDMALLHHLLFMDDIPGATEFLQQHHHAIISSAIPIERARSLEMARMLYRDFRADPYRYIGFGSVALDEMARSFPIREFLVEARQQTPRQVQLYIDRVEREKRTVEDANVIRVNIHPRDRSPLNLRHLMFNGIFPEFVQLPELAPERARNLKTIEDMFFRRYNDATLEFWTEETVDQLAKSPDYFIAFPSFENMAEYAQQTAYSLPLLLFEPDLLYSVSRRPRTDMHQFRAATPLDPPPNAIFLPVARYAAGMRGGLFYTEPEEDFCGTFYYLEEESDTTLAVSRDRVLWARDKADALNRLNEKKGLEPIVQDIWDTSRDAHLLYTPEEFNEYLTKTHRRPHYPPQAGVQMDRQYYVAHALNAYGYEDVYDQELCNAAQEAGYDVVMLQNMVGARKIVSEVLDVRPRPLSFAHLSNHPPTGVAYR